MYIFIYLFISIYDVLRLEILFRGWIVYVGA